MVRVAGMILVGTGAWMAATLGSSYLHAGAALRAASEFAGMGIAVVLAVQLATPPLKAVAGVALLAESAWGRSLAVVALLLDIATLGVSIRRYHGLDGAAPPLAAGGGQEMAVVERSSALPMHAIWLSSVVALVLLGAAVVRDRRRMRPVPRCRDASE